MKKIGLIGGISWVSSAEYYKIINKVINEKLGGSNSGEIILYSLNLEGIEKAVHRKDFSFIAKEVIKVGKSLEKAGADFALICSNTIHEVYEELEESVNIPLIHIVDSIASEIKRNRLQKVGLLGTEYTMESGFYKDRLLKNHNIGCIIPNKKDRKIIDDIIFSELIYGYINEKSKKIFKDIMKKLEKDGAEGIILGCTEIPLLIKQSDVKIPVLDSTTIHAINSANFALR